MNRAFGIINFAGNHIKVDGLQDFRPVGAFSFLGRYRIIDFPISNMSNSGIDNIEVFIRRKPRSLTEHLGTGRHYNINSKRGSLNIMYTEHGQIGDIYSTDITAYMENIECLEEMPHEYVVIAPSYMVYKADYSEFLDAHIESGADISMMYHSVDNAKDAFLNCNALNINKQKGVLAIDRITEMRKTATFPWYICYEKRSLHRTCSQSKQKNHLCTRLPTFLMKNPKILIFVRYPTVGSLRSLMILTHIIRQICLL